MTYFRSSFCYDDIELRKHMLGFSSSTATFLLMLTASLYLLTPLVQHSDELKQVDVRVQQDAQGFLLDVLDELQRALPKPTTSTAASTTTATTVSSESSSTQATAAAAADFIAQTLEGKHVSQISLAEGDNGSDIREQEQPFMCYPLEVKNLSGLTQALAASTAAEAVEGYRWDEVTVISVTVIFVTVFTVTALRFYIMLLDYVDVQ
jgi:hypothetical protein